MVFDSLTHRENRLNSNTSLFGGNRDVVLWLDGGVCIDDAVHVSRFGLMGVVACDHRALRVRAET